MNANVYKMVRNLYNCRPLQNAVSVFYSECQDAVKRIGSVWHLGVFFWSCIFVLYRQNNSSICIGLLNTRIMICALTYLFFHNFILSRSKRLSFIRFKEMSFLAKILTSITAPVAFLYHMWFPVHEKLACIFPIGSYPDLEFEAPFQYFHVMTVALAALMTYIVTVRPHGEEVKNVTKRRRISLDPVLSPNSSFCRSPDSPKIMGYNGILTRSRCSELIRRPQRECTPTRRYTPD